MVNKWIEKIIPENFYDTKFTCSPIAPNSVLYPWTIFVNGVWLFSFVGFLWWYSDPSMYLVQSVIQKEFEKEGFVCSPLGYDEFYSVDLGYAQCLDLVRIPNEINVDLTNSTGTEVYSFIPFDPIVVRMQDKKGVDKSIYNPVGGGTSAASAADALADFAAEMAASQEEQNNYNPFGRRLMASIDEDIEYAGLTNLSGCNCNMIFISDDANENEELKFFSESKFGGGGGGVGMGRKLLFGMDFVDPSPSPPPPSPYFACTMDQATAILMYKQFMAVNDPCEFVKRNTPFQCVKEEPQPFIQRLSLAYANSGLFYSMIAALAVNYMYATKKVTLETVDIEQLQKMASMNQVTMEEPAK